jgi:hypothetical protein
MKRHFSIGAISIAYSFLASNIVEAEVMKSKLSSTTRSILTSERNKSSNSTVISKEKLKAIYNALNEHYRRTNTNALNRSIDTYKARKKLGTLSESESIIFVVVKKMTITDYSINSQGNERLDLESIVEETTYDLKSDRSSSSNSEITFSPSIIAGSPVKHLYKYKEQVSKFNDQWALSNRIRDKIN